MSDVIDVRGLSVRYRGADRRALDDVSFRVGAGEVAGVLGATGAGKSTLLKCLAGVIPHYADDARHIGDVRVLGTEIRAYGRLADVSARVGLVLQDPEAQLVNTVVHEELAWGMENRGVPVPRIEAEVARVAELFGIGDLLDRFTYALSGGEKQRVIVAATFCLGPEVILLDEPTSELDPVGTRDVMRAVRTLAAEGVTVVLAEHEVEELAACADRLLVLDDGRLADSGTPREVLTRLSGPAADYRPQVLDLALRLGDAWPGADLPLTTDEAVAQWTA